MSAKTFDDLYTEIDEPSYDVFPEDARPGDAVVYFKLGIAYTLIALLIDDGCYQTWDCLITMGGVEEIGREQWLTLSEREPLMDGTFVRGC